MGASLSCTEDDGTPSDTSTDPPKDSFLGIPLYLVGILLSFVSCLATSYGTLIQKRAHALNGSSDKKAREWMGLILTPTWLFGLFIMVIMPLPMDFVAYSLAPQSLLAPTGALTIVSNALLAPCLLSEKLSRPEAIATLIIVSGVVLSTIAGDHADKSYTACTLLELYTYNTFYLPVVFFSVTAYVGYLVRDKRELLGKWRPALIAYIGGALGGLSNLFFKGTGELAFSGEASTWATIHPYYHILLVAILALLQMSHINIGIKEYEAVSFLPMYSCFYIVSVSIVGGIFFSEFSDFDAVQWIMFPVGVGVTLVGIIILTNAAKDNEPLLAKTAQTQMVLARIKQPSP